MRFLTSIFLLFLSTQVCGQHATLDLWPNYHTVGVNVALSTPDPESDASAELEYTTGNGPFQDGFPLSRVDHSFQRLSGCVLWCKPATEYRIRVTLRDKTTDQLDGVVLTGTITTRPEPKLTVPTRSVYVSPSGAGTVFTKQQPGSLVAALRRVQPGDRLVLLSGRYYVGQLKLAKSGRPGAPIQIVGEQGKTVVIDGSQPSVPKWRKTKTEGMYVCATEATNPNLVIADGVRLYPHQSMTDLKGNKIAIGIGRSGVIRFDAELDGFYRNPSSNPLLNSNWQRPKQLYVKFRDNSDPNKKKFAIARHQMGLTIAKQSHIQLQNLNFANFGRSPAGTALSLTTCEDILLSRCKFGVNDIGVSLGGHCRRITIQHCEFFDAMKGWYAWKMKATYDQFAPYSSIFPYLGRMLERGGLLYRHGFSGRGIVVRHCRFHDFAQAGHMGPASFNTQHKESHEIDFHNNRVWNCAEDGLELDADARNVRIWRNVFHNCNACISLAVARNGPTYIVRNLFHSISPDIFAIQPQDGLQTQVGHPFKFQTGDTKSRIGDLFFIHNTVHAPVDAEALDLSAPGKWKRFFARNNLFVSERGKTISIRSVVPYPVDLDYNGYFKSTPGHIGVVDQNRSDRKPGKTINGLADFRSLGFEKHGLIADPLFMNVEKHDYRLTPSSPAIDRGVVIPGINDKHCKGPKPDLGAFERQ